MVDIGQTEMIWLIFRIGTYFANRGYVFRFQTVCDTHFIQISIGCKRKYAGILIFPAKAAYSRLSGRFQNRNLNGLTMNHAIALRRLIGSNGKERSVIDGLDETVT